MAKTKLTNFEQIEHYKNIRNLINDNNVDLALESLLVILQLNEKNNLPDIFDNKFYKNCINTAKKRIGEEIRNDYAKKKGYIKQIKRGNENPFTGVFR